MSGRNKPDFNNALAVGQDLDLKLPDSPAVRDAYAQAETKSQPWLFNHVVRSWLYGAKLAQHGGLASDAELVAVSFLLQDLGLARGGAPDRRFEVVGADAGRDFALSHNMGERRAETVWELRRAPHHRIDRAAQGRPRGLLPERHRVRLRRTWL